MLEDMSVYCARHKTNEDLAQQPVWAASVDLLDFVLCNVGCHVLQCGEA